MYKIQKYILIWILILVILPSCALFKQNKAEPTVAELAKKGVEAYNAEKYRTALKNFEKIKELYPFSKYSILAELKLADSNFYLKRYDEAIFAYNEFRSLHPKNEAIPYVLYQIGMSHFKQTDTSDREQVSAYKALEAFKYVIINYPESLSAQKAKKYIDECFNRIIEHEFLIGKFYFKTKHYKAAISRFKNIIERYPDTDFNSKAMIYIKNCEDALKKEKIDKDKKE
jgi:outer membrane protein assembly factor BamD